MDAVKFEFVVTVNLNLGERVTHAIERIAMNMQELTQALTDAGTAVGDLGGQLTKSLGEISTDISGLQATIAAGAQSTPEVDAALVAFQTKLAAAKAVAQQLDDIVPDPQVTGTGGDTSTGGDAGTGDTGAAGTDTTGTATAP